MCFNNCRFFNPWTEGCRKKKWQSCPSDEDQDQDQEPDFDEPDFDDDYHDPRVEAIEFAGIDLPDSKY